MRQTAFYVLYIRTLCVLMLSSLLGVLNLSAREAYAYLSDDHTTLSFFYDDYRSSLVTGTSYDLNTGQVYPGWKGESTVLTEKYETYAVYNSDDYSLTFYYDDLRDSRTGQTYNLNTGTEEPGWLTYDGIIRNIVFDPTFADARPTTTSRWFQNMIVLKNITGLQYLNTSHVTNMSYMFYGCSALTSLKLSTFNTCSVTDMSYMFFKCTNLIALDLSPFVTTNVTNMAFMFSSCEALHDLNLTSFDTSNVTNMENMFQNCYTLGSLDLSTFNTSKVTNMSSMFITSSALRTIYVTNLWSTEAAQNSSECSFRC